MNLYEYVVHAFDYNPETGIIKNKIRRNQSGKIGDVVGCRGRDGYLRIAFSGKKYLAHRIAWLYVSGIMPDHQIDHINGDRSDNRWCNLRPASLQQNSMNKLLARNNTSGFKGVSYSDRHQQWSARIQSGRITNFLGLFRSPELAHAAYCKAADALHGQFASYGNGKTA